MSAVHARIEQIESARFKNVVLDYFGSRQGKRERIKVRQLILVKPESRLRVQTKLPGSEEILNLLVSNENVFSVHQRDSNTYYTGTPTREHINRMTPVPLNLSAKDIIRVMLGGAPWDRFLQEDAPPQSRWNKNTGRYCIFVSTKKGGKLLMEVRHTDFAVEEVRELNAKGDTIYHYTASKWKRHGTLTLPTFVHFIWPAKDLDFSLDVGDTQLNVLLPDTLFTFPPPPGSQVFNL